MSGTAIESPMEATLRLTVVKDRPIKELQFETPRILGASGAAGYHVTTAHGPDLYENAKNSVRAMIDFLVEHHGLTRSQASALCSTAIDLKISEIVDAPVWLVSAHLPRPIFRGRYRRRAGEERDTGLDLVLSCAEERAVGPALDERLG